MNTMHGKSVFTALTAVMLWAAALPVAIAQETSRSAAVVYPISLLTRNTEDLHHRGQEVHALDGIDLTIDYGEFVAILEPSGSGKSTLLHIIGCLDAPTSGSYELNGIDVSVMDETDKAHVRNQRIGFVFQGFNLLPRTKRTSPGSRNAWCSCATARSWKTRP